MDIDQRVQERKSKLINIFDNKDQVIRDWKNKGGKCFGYLCTYVPEEILFAADILPVRVLGHTKALENVSAHFQTFICALIKSSLDKGLKGELDDLDGIVIPYTCDGMRLLYDVWSANLPQHASFLLDIPSHLNMETTEKVFYEAQNNFRKEIEKYIDSSLSEKKLRNAIHVYNQFRKLAKRFYHLRLKHRLPLTEAEVLKIYLASFSAPKDLVNDMLSDLLESLEEWVSLSKDFGVDDRVPLHVSGSVVVDPTFFDKIEQAGGTVVSDDLCTGTRYYWDLVEESGDAFEAIVKRYFTKVPCPCKYPANNRRPFFRDRIQESKAKGVMFLLEKYCDPHLFEYPALREYSKSFGLPDLYLETELVASGGEQIMTRIESFIDIVKRR